MLALLMSPRSVGEKPAPVVRRTYPAIERRPRLSREALIRDYMLQNRPVVIPTESAAWRARWEPAALVERYGRCAIEAEETREIYVGDRALVQQPLGPTVEGMLRGDTSMRWKGLEFLSKVPGMREDLEVNPPPYKALMPESAWDARSTLWIAPKGTTSSLHHDGNLDNLNMQVSGKKIFLLIPPPQHAALHFYGSAESPVNPFAPDLARFPRFVGASPVEATLEPGDVLLVPKYWWHCVYASEASVNLACCFRWEGELSPWRVLDGAPLVHRSLTVLSAEMKRRGYGKLADATRRVWLAMHDRVVPRVTPQPRYELVDPEAA